MKRIILVLLSLFIGNVATGLGQAPPPPPLIYTPPVATEISTFASPNDVFEVDFPGKPSESNQKLDGGVVTTYRVNRKGSNSVVAITTPSATIDLSGRREEIFKSMRDGISRRPRTKIVKENDIALGEYLGREFEVDYGLQYGIVRVYIVGGRIIEIQSDVTNWSISVTRQKLIGEKKLRVFSNHSRF